MQLHQLQTSQKRKKARRVGRGGKKGTYSGRGMKGQKSRAGHRLAPIVREVLKRYPKQKGYRVHGGNVKPTTLKLEDLEKNFAAKEKVTPQTLVEKRVLRRVKGSLPACKIVAGGKLTKALSVENCAVSKTAKEEIVKAGGSVA